jgi:hypothetical protein
VDGRVESSDVVTDERTFALRNFTNAPKKETVAEVGNTVTVSSSVASNPRAGYVQC